MTTLRDVADAAENLARRADALGSRLDAEFEESKHPRAEDGKFGSGGAARIKTSEADKTKVASRAAIVKALQSQGWLSGHNSVKAGSTTSSYLSPSGDLEGKHEIRISNHELGSKNGERQGGKWSTNIVIQPDLSLYDHLKAIENEDYRDGNSGFSSGYSFEEWERDQ